MYQNKYYIVKLSGFFQDTLEAYGIVKLLDMILNDGEKLKSEINISNQVDFYEIIIENFEEVHFKEKIEAFFKNPRIGFDYIFKQTDPKKGGTQMPKEIESGKELNIPIFDINKEWKVVKEYNSKDKTENQKLPNTHFDIYNLFSNFLIEFVGKENLAGTKQAGMFTRTFLQLYYNRKYFRDFLNGIFFLYGSIDNQLNADKYSTFLKLSFPHDKKKYSIIASNHKIAKTTFNQLLNPYMSKGINSEKMKLSESSKEPDLLREYLKILGSFSCMFSLGGNKTMDDYKVYVVEPQKVDFILQADVIKSFKRSFYTNSTYKSDIYASLLFSSILIEHLEIQQENLFDFDYTPSNFIKGFYSCHYMTIKKSPPKKHAPINFTFISLPRFVKAENKIKADEWLSILDEFYNIIKIIRFNEKAEESGDTIKGLKFFRDFIGTSQIQMFFSFTFWHSGYIMQQLSKGNKRFVRTFKIETLNKFYTNMDTKELNLKEIIENGGFKAITKAIRNSTIRLQIKSRFQETHKKFQVRYGFAQELVNKSKSKNDLVKFISEFIGKYDAETAKHKENNPKVIYRANVRQDEKDSFYLLLDKYSDSIEVIAALLASYGFALEKYDESEDRQIDKLSKEAEKFGYQLVPIENTPLSIETEINKEEIQ